MLNRNERMNNHSCHISMAVLTAQALKRKSHRGATNYANLLGHPLRDCTTYLAAAGCSVHIIIQVLVKYKCSYVSHFFNVSLLEINTTFI